MSPPILRPYQIDCVDALRRSYGTGHRAPLLQLPTAAGKTIVFTSVADGARRKGKRVLIVVHRRELLTQAVEKLAAAGIKPGIIAAEAPPDYGAMTQAGSIQTIAGRLDKLPPFDLLIFDEAHHCRAGQWRKLIEAQPQSRLLGVTATPCRLDGQGLGVHAGGCFDDLILGPEVQELVGDAVGAYRLRADHQPAIAYCVSIGHAAEVANAFAAAGYRAKMVCGKTPTRERDAAIAGLGNGQVEVLCSCDLISEGLDVPAVSAVILLRPTQSLVLHRQQVGRGLRVAASKAFLVVNDHVGNCLQHGLPTTPVEWSLEGIERKPKPPPGWTCECGCHNPISARVCAACGKVRPGVVNPRAPLDTVDGELAELSADLLDALRRMSYQQVVSEQRSEAELRAIAAVRGYHPRWADHRLREQQQASRTDGPDGRAA
jgi:DNA repair protein RadD